MRTIILPVGPPGAGKSTLCNGLQQFMLAVSRRCSVINLDPANDNIPYDAAADVREIVDVEEVMEREELGPNGGVLWAMEELEQSFEWLEEKLEECGQLNLSAIDGEGWKLIATLEETIILDPPGQPELTIHHMALPRILHRLEKLEYRVRLTHQKAINMNYWLTLIRLSSFSSLTVWSSLVQVYISAVYSFAFVACYIYLIRSSTCSPKLTISRPLVGTIYLSI